MPLVSAVYYIIIFSMNAPMFREATVVGCKLVLVVVGCRESDQTLTLGHYNKVSMVIFGISDKLT